MNWDALGAIAELLGATGVIITLIYLAGQLRQNTKALQSSTFQQLSESLGENAKIAAESPQILQILLKVEREPDSLSVEDKALFHFYAITAIRRHETAFVQRQLKVVEPTLMSGFEKSTLALFQSKAWRGWWGENKELFSDDFCAWIDQHLATGDTRDIHFFMRDDSAAP